MPCSSLQPDPIVLHEMVSIPVRILIEGAVSIGLEVWSWVIDARPDLESRVMIEVSDAWYYTVQLKQGLFSDSLKCVRALYCPPSISSCSADPLG